MILIGMTLVVYNVQAECTLRVAYEESKIFHAMDASGSVRGIDADMLSALANAIDCHLKYKQVPWKRTLAWIKSGRIDVAFGASYTEEREQYVYYSNAYRSHPHLLARFKKAQTTFGGLEGFLKEGKKIGVVSAWHYTDKIHEVLNYPSYLNKVHYVYSFSLLPNLHKNGKIEAFLAMPSQMLENGFSRQELEQNYEFQRVDTDKLHFIFSRRTVDKNIVDKFNEILDKKIQEGFLAKTCERYQEHIIGGCGNFSLP